jgi:hypothetical protein
MRTAEPDQQAETHVLFREVIGLLAVNLHDAGEVPPQRSERGRTPEGARCSIRQAGLGVANEPAARTYWT